MVLGLVPSVSGLFDQDTGEAFGSLGGAISFVAIEKPV